MINYSLKYFSQNNSYITINNQFGELKINLANQIYLPHGLIGMAECTNFCLATIADQRFKDFKLLQEVNNYRYSFLTLPIDIKNNIIQSEDLKLSIEYLGIRPEQVIILLIASTKLINSIKKVVVNTRAPVFIDISTNTAAQYVIPNNNYTIQHVL